MLQISGRELTLEQIDRVARGEERVSVHPDALGRMAASRRVVEELVRAGKPVYGVNTGFGRLAGIRIPDSDLALLQTQLVRSHACGCGHPLGIPETRAVMLLRANGLAGGFSGARPELLRMLVGMLERGVHPVIPEKGSVGASGDLAPLAHLALAMLGEGECFWREHLVPGGVALREAGLDPLRLEAKEGLSLLNGTQAMAGVGALALFRARHLVSLANVAGAMSLEALRGTPVAFDERIHDARPHPGQREVARHMRELLQGSEIRRSHVRNDLRVQDAYSLRCIPQVHGAVLGVVGHARAVVETETGAATDNPLVFAESGEILSGGNFHGAPLAFAFDYAAIGLTGLLSMVERRVDRVINPDLNEGLPPFLTTTPGTSSGFMLVQVTVAALLSECRVLAHPASVDSVPTSGGKEDHVSMGMTAALKLRAIVDNLETALAIELLTAAQALEFRLPLKPGRGVGRAFEIVRGSVPRLDQDRPMSGDIARIAGLIRDGAFRELEIQ